LPRAWRPNVKSSSGAALMRGTTGGKPGKSDHGRDHNRHEADLMISRPMSNAGSASTAKMPNSISLRQSRMRV
jgi:hypothetical protein